MFCKKCGNPIDDKTTTCPFCGQVLEPAKPSMSSGVVILLLFLFFPVGLYLMWARTNWTKVAKIIVTVIIAIVAIVAIADGETETPQGGSNNPSSSLSQDATNDNANDATEGATEGTTIPVDPYADAIAITADELFAAYDTNEVAADNQYKGKELKVTGTIKDIGKDILDHTYITLDTGNLICSVQCYFENNQLDAVAELKKDQIITLVGKCNGQSMNVILKNSVIVSVTDATTENTIPGETTTGTTTPAEQQPEETQAATAAATTGEKNALRAANNYLGLMAFSYEGLIEQLEFDGYTNAECVYAADNCGADWNEQAVRKAKSYLDLMPFSRSGLIDQLVFDGFTYEQAEYGVDANDM